MNQIYNMNLTLSKDPTDLVLGASYFLIGLLGIIGNGINIIGYMKDKKLQNVNNRFIIAVALSDFTMGFVAIFNTSYYVFSAFENIINPVICIVQAVIYVLCIRMTVTLVSVIGLNRYVYVVHNRVIKKQYITS